MDFSRLLDKLPGRRMTQAQAAPARASAEPPNAHPPEQGSWLALAGLADGYLARMQPRAKDAPELFGQAQAHAKTLSELGASLDEALDDKTALRFFETLGELGVVCSKSLMGGDS